MTNSMVLLPIRLTISMLTFKEYCLLEASDREIMKAKNSQLQQTEKNGWKITVRPHAGSRAVERSDMDAQAWSDFHHKVTSHLNDHDVPDGEHVMYSRVKRQGVVVDVNRQHKKITYVTALPPGVTRSTKPGTGKHMVESVDTSVIFFE